MTDDLSTVRDDIAYVRDMAERGRTAPLLSGPVLVAAAIVFGAASIAHYALAQELIAASVWAPLWLWIGAGLVFAAVLAVLLRRIDAAPGADTAVNRAVGAAWSGIGFSIFAIWGGLLAIGLTTGRWDMMAAMPIVVFAAYGAAWMVAGVMASSGWMRLTAVACYVGAAALGLVAGQAVGFLLFAALLVGCVLLPGLVLMRQAAAPGA